MLTYYVQENVGVEMIVHTKDGAVYQPYLLVENEVVEFKYILNQYVHAVYNNRDLRITLNDWKKFSLHKRILKKEME